ncbi:UNVERIFIED_CONTAM: bioD [Trichonephila clavipes]|uniref:ATP-dependent dethiobiotin synthetase BioD n=1 Tax=Sphingobacterium tenebrionis TaxID=3111775 RepID=A0ABU8I549_9SPHI
MNIKPRQYFVTGIGTGVGKTICSAMLAQLWQMAYWKPIQSGDLNQSDSMMLNHLLDHKIQIFKERFRLHTAASPHQSAFLDGIEMHLEDFELPNKPIDLLVEGAGGLFVPINDKECIIDLIKKLAIPTILVCRDYLGTINHSLLSIKALENHEIPLHYLVLNGEFNPFSKEILMKHMPEDCRLIQMPELEGLNPAQMQHALSKITIEN